MPSALPITTLLNVIVNFRRALAALWIGALLLIGAQARAQVGDAVEVEAQRLVHLLGYVAADYGGAVERGVVKNPDEYAEQLSLLGEAEKIAGRIGPKLAKQDLRGDLARVKALVEGKADEAAVAGAITAVRDDVVTGFRLEQAPTRRPDRARGKALFLEHCATCHGETGRGDTQRAASLTPRPADFLSPAIGESITPYRVATTVRFGVNGTSMIPFTFLGDDERWDLAFYVTGLRHTGATDGEAPVFSLGELAVRSDAELRQELTAAGVGEGRRDAMIAALRTRVPFAEPQPNASLPLARSKLDRARIAVDRGELGVARGLVIDAYLEGIEPAEGPLKSRDPALARTLEERFMTLRGRLDANAPPDELRGAIAELMRDVTRAETLLSGAPGEGGFVSVAVQSGGILLREGVEAALLIAALLGLATQAGLGDRKRWVHLGWAVALVLGLATWVVSSRLIAISGASRELVEGVTALLATAVLFYVSYSLLAKRQVARWMKFLKEQISPRKAALSLFAVSFLAAYREAFETVLFYQALLSTPGSTVAALAGAGAGAAALVVLVVAYSRAGRFAPPQLFFKISSYLLYGLAVVFAGQGIAALQVVGVAPLHTFRFVGVPWLGIYPTLETCAAQLLMIGLAVVAALVSQPAGPKPEAAKAKAEIA